MTIKHIFLAFIILIIGGCASQGNNPNDPYENWNRSVYKFNKVLDENLAKPATLGYKAITPDFIETGVSNIFSNIEDVPNMVNNFLQGKIADSFSDLGRLLLNTTIGVGGLWDPATHIGFEKHDEDFGQTLGAWGVSSGAYLMLPIMGPTTLRDIAAYPVNHATDMINQIDHDLTRYEVTLLQLLDKRAGLIPLEDQLKGLIDEYAFVRDVYLQNRRYKVLDGDIPFDDAECEEEDEDDCEF